MIINKEWIIKSRLGAMRRNQLYGNPGTSEGRSKGGQVSARLFKLNPDFAKKKGFVIRKAVNTPKRSAKFAEFIGIMLGDGGIRNSRQIAVSFDKNKDKRYIRYVAKMVKELFGLNCSIYRRSDCNGADLVVGGANLIDFLVQQGLNKGNKVKNQVGIPAWICDKLMYRIACLRGLMDTDGGFYWHNYSSYGKKYRYLKFCFTNASKPILSFVYESLQRSGIKAYLSGNHVSIYSIADLKKYVLKVGLGNSRQMVKFKSFQSNKIIRRDARDG